MDTSIESLDVLNNTEPVKQDGGDENVPLNAEMDTHLEPIDMGLDISSPSEESVSSSLFKELNDSDFPELNFDTMVEELLEPSPQGLDSITGYHTFEINDLSKLLKEKEQFQSPKFRIGNYTFNLITGCQRADQLLSVYLEGHPVDESENQIWSFPVHFTFMAWDPENISNEKHTSTKFRFNQRVTDWGFTHFLDRKDRDNAHFFRKNRMNFTVFVRIIDDYTNVLYSDFRDYDSKKYTGYVGIENQGATCYLNSLLQSYFFTKSFRKKVYQIPTEDEIKFDFDSYEDYKRQPKTVSLALQRIFYKLQTSDVAINSLELTHSFGWTTADAFTQHDVQELNRILMDKLETKMKGTSIEDCLNYIFVGKMKSFIRCINVNYESSRIEDFWDIQLNVKGLKNIKESFDNYVEIETLDGDNQYDASGYGLQDAEKGVIFEQFPDVLHVQLKRYEYDFETDNMAKINDRYEFSELLDLKPYISKTSEFYDEDWEYQLHGVLIHQGDVSVGHYYAMIRVTEDNVWYKFDDDRVSRVTPQTVFEEGFGCGSPIRLDRNMSREEQMNYIIKHQTSAYMLVYIRKSKVASVLAEVQESDIPSHIPKQINFEREQEARIMKERKEMHLYANFKIYTDESFRNYEGFDIGPNEQDYRQFNEELFDPKSLPINFRLLKTDPWNSIYDTIFQNIGKEGNPEKYRLWNMSVRTNRTIRPDISIENSFENLEGASIGDVCLALENGTGKRRYNGPDKPLIISLYLEDASKDLKHLAIKSPLISDSVSFDERLGKLFQLTDNSVDAKLEPIDENTSFLAFVKYFSYEEQKIKSLTHVILPLTSTPEILKQLLCDVLNLPDDSNVNFYEELDFNKRLDVKSDVSFYKNEIGTGDIICIDVQNNNQSDRDSQRKYQNALERYTYLETRIKFHFIPLESIEEDDEDYVLVDKDKKLKIVEKWLSSKSSYMDIATAIGEEIKIAPEYIKLSIISNGKKSDVKVDYNFHALLGNIPKFQSVKLHYEVLKIPVHEFEGMEMVHVFWVGNGICKEERHDFSLPRNSTVENVVDKLSIKVAIDPNIKDDIFCWVSDHFHKVKDVLDLDDTINGNMYLIMGIFPQYKEVYNSNPADMALVSGFQCHTFADNSHGLPFVFDIVKGEKLVDSMSRLRKLLGLSENEFKHTKIALSNRQNIDYLDIAANPTLELFDVYKKAKFSLVVDHPDRKSRHGSYQSSIKIM
ncbi:hypothetical protein CANINC_002819 [Pichia inconspicua]|uniref:ubiquitinyl hydrolase 1 n=1 Tax=Pichia inconspicua TaxID=52247 RepID=A0A4T0X0N8_9ASCO|nr:hypothetical protein CANINC_002819 [[Candida] inconspicua]